MNQKVFLIGIDGGTFDIINPLVEKGDLPNISRFMREGTWSHLTSTLPPMTFPAWPASITGVNPGKLGVSYFIKDLHNYDPSEFVTTADIKTKKIWHYLGEYGKKSIIINIPYLYPPEKINGIMACYFNSRGREDNVLTHPQELAKELSDVIDLDRLLKSRKDFAHISEFSKHTNRSQKEFWLDRLVNFHRTAIEYLKEATLYLMTHYDWDFVMVVFNSSDFVQHKLWCYSEKDHPAYDKELAGKYGDVINDCYKRIDKAIGTIVNKIDKDTTVLLMSDHGFSSLKMNFYINQWLKQKNLLYFKGKYKIALCRVLLSQILTKLRISRFVSLLPERLKNMQIPILWRKRKAFSESVDWKRTKAYAHLNGININLKDRESQGIVTRDEYRDVVDFIKKELFTITDDNTKQPILSKVYEKNEIYHGPYAELATDLQFFFDPPVYGISTELFSDDRLFKVIDKTEKVTGAHQSATQGIFIAHGKTIGREQKPDSPSIIDITPTILHLLGIPIPNEMDGRVLTEILEKEFLDTNPVRFTDDSVFEEGVTKLTEEFSDEMLDKVKSALRDLGYID
ncbi:MAG: alkaline phosphatase family protein [Candidatus Brocadia sp.]|nr:alkaline phosphatase family protein [Candidatus Brocadia sp.]